MPTKTITRGQLRSELDDLLRRADIDPRSVKLTFSRFMERLHKRKPRQHASIDLNKREIEVASAILSLAPRYRLGVLAHEVGHLRGAEKFGNQHTEEQADRCAYDATKVRIDYDKSWSGHNPHDATIKGMQVGTDTLRKKSPRALDAEIAEVLGRPIKKSL